MSGQVTSVVDGDTVHVKLDSGPALTVRLDGIDTPETGEPFSTQARNATRVLLFDKHVQVRGADVDRYNRLIARITLGDADSSIELVRTGLACHFTRYSSDRALAAAQVEARVNGRGFWAPSAQKPACVAANAIAPVSPPAAAVGPFHGNSKSRVYHAPSCRNYRCQSCTVVFKTAEDAQRAGFRPAGDCIDR